MMSGVYRIVNLVTNRTYIGSSLNVPKRLRDHKKLLAGRRHSNRHLQSSWMKHGQDCFSFDELVSCDCSELTTREQQFMDAYILHDLPLFNILPSSPSRAGMKRAQSLETREKIRATLMGHPVTDETREKMSMKWVRRPLSQQGLRNLKDAHAGNKYSVGYTHTPEARRKIGLAHTWKIVSSATREKLRAASLGNTNGNGRILSKESRERIGAAHRGKVVSDETRAKLSAAKRLRYGI